MITSARILVGSLLGGLLWVGPVRAQESGVIHLGGGSGSPSAMDASGGDAEVLGRQGFDYGAFESRLEALWFQRKAMVEQGRPQDASRQAEVIRDFATEEGVHRLEDVAGALLVESRRLLKEGNTAAARASLDLAEALDPGRPQVHFARAALLWRSSGASLSAAGESLAALRGLARQVVGSTYVLQRGCLAAVLALLGTIVIFSLAMLFRYQAALRHEVEEYLTSRGAENWRLASGWAVVMAPLLLWGSAGWAWLYWIVVIFRFMRRAEKAVAVVLLLASVAAVPAYRTSVALYGLTADPTVRATLESAGGGYDPQRVVNLQRVVEAHPDEPTFRFLLAGLFKKGRFFEEAYEQYKKVLALDPGNYQAHVNLGNIFFSTGQHGEAVSEYLKAIALKPRAVLAYFNLHLAQSENFRFREAEEALLKAREIDAKAIAELLAEKGREGDRPVVVDATIDLGSIWQAALEGRGNSDWFRTAEQRGFWRPLPRQFLNPLSLAAFLALLASVIVPLAFATAPPASLCIRCGRPFCHRCKSDREVREYCTQCLHLFILGDGLAPETKTSKLYEIERHERLTRRWRFLVSFVLPGTGQLLRGKVVAGSTLVFVWFAAWILWQPAVLEPFDRMIGFAVGREMLRGGTVPAIFDLEPSLLIGVPAALAAWLAANVRPLTHREA